MNHYSIRDELIGKQKLIKRLFAGTLFEIIENKGNIVINYHTEDNYGYEEPINNVELDYRTASDAMIIAAMMHMRQR